MVTFDDAPEIAARIVRAKREAEQECRRVNEGIAHLLTAALVLYPSQRGFRTILMAAIEELRRPVESRAVPPDDDQEDVE